VLPLSLQLVVFRNGEWSSIKNLCMCDNSKKN
jgi:hypothetical protein